MNDFKLSALAALGCLSLAAMPVEAIDRFHYKANGGFASFTSNIDDMGGYTQLEVSKGGTPQAPSTHLHYNFSRCNEETRFCHGVTGSGLIPNQDFKDGTKNASLSTDPTFRAVSWTWNRSTGERTETPTTVGTIDLAWKASGAYTSRTVGSRSEIYETFSFRSIGQSSRTHATATGTVGGEALGAGVGAIGTHSNNDLYFFEGE